MANKNNLQCWVLDDEVYLAFYDSLHGEDRVFIVEENTAFEYNSDDDRFSEEVSLNQVLRDIALKLDAMERTANAQIAGDFRRAG